jgi:hypothetical protein
MVDFQWGDPDAERIYAGLMEVVSAVRDLQVSVSAMLLEVSRCAQADVVAAKLADIEAKVGSFNPV